MDVMKEKDIEGVVKFFNAGGWGFIEVKIDEQEQDVFCHKNDIAGEQKILERGEHVRLDVKLASRGLQAMNIRKLN